MTRVILTGHTEREGESLDFKIGDWSGGVGLMIRRTGKGSSVETGAGIWPSIEKAQSIADETAKRLLSPDSIIEWKSIESAPDLPPFIN
jgi:hypothetical protein